MNKERRSYPVIHIGTSFLLVIFIVLCLVIFAVLSLSSALRDQNYVEKEAARQTAYYEANAAAQEKLRDTVTDFLQSPEETTVSYSVPIDERQTLEVTVLLSADGGLANGVYQIEAWKTVNSSDWNGSSTLPVMESQ
ncbi:MAG: hypothetical protein PHQ72_03205 [Hespellia sp.]|nr:hypothetical protein [Hespellia sp.]